MVSMGSFLDVSNWLNPAKLTLYSQTNSSAQWIQDFCGQRTTEPCEQICEQDTGEFTFTLHTSWAVNVRLNTASPFSEQPRCTEHIQLLNFALGDK